MKVDCKSQVVDALLVDIDTDIEELKHTGVQTSLHCSL